VWRALFRTCKCVRGGSQPFSPLCLARGAGGGQERSRTRKRMQVYRVGVALARMWSGLATINISHRVESSECVRSQSWTSNTFSISRSRIHASVRLLVGVTHSFTHSTFIYMRVNILHRAVCKCMQQRRHTKRDIYQNKLCALWYMSVCLCDASMKLFYGK